MPTNVRTGEKDLVTQYARGTVFQPADPVFLKPKGDPGVAPHFNISTSINNAAGTVFNRNTKVATKDSYLGAGRHAPVVIAGRNTGQVDGDNGFMSWMKNVYIEGRNAVMHGVQTGVNALWSMLPPGLRTAVENGTQIAQGLTPGDFGDAASEDAAALMDALMSTDTLIALAQTAALMGLSAVPVVGQLAGGAAAVQRLSAAIDSVEGAADELKEMMERWSKPMSPAQIAAERKKLASFLIRVGASAILAALGKAMPRLSGRSKGKQNSDKDVVVGTKPRPKQTTCACATGSPVIIATGEKSLVESDFDLPGPIALDWRRSYRSGNAHHGWFGQGWSAPLAVELLLAADGVTYREAGGRAIALPFIATGAEHFDAYERFTLRRPAADCWEIAFRNGRTERFERVRDDLFALPLAAIVDRNGNRIGLEYPAPPEDPFAPWRARVIVDAAGRRLHLEWDRRGLLLAVQCQADPLAPPATLASYAYDGEGNLVGHVDACGASRTYEWRNGVLVGYTRADGARYCAEYDEYSPFGRVVHSWAAEDGRGLRFAYDDRARTTRVTDSLGRGTCYEYDGRMDIVAVTGPDGVRTETPFDANGNPRGPVDPLGRQAHYRFDERGNLTELVNAAGARTAIAYNGLDLPVRYTDPLDHTWLSEFDARGNLVATIDPLGQATRYTHDGRGQVVSVTDARHGVKHLAWDATGNLVAITDCSGQRTGFSYDALGRLQSRVDALGGVTHYGWDAAGRLTAMTEATGATHRYEWSAGGKLLGYTDPLGATTRYRYNGHGEPVSRRDANGHALQYVYDEAGRLVQLVNENGDVARFGYDLGDRLCDETGFDGRHQRYCYNAADELTHLVEAGGSEFGPGKVTHFERDALGRLVSRWAEGDAACHARFTYDRAGRLLTADNPATAIAFAYDPVGQLLSETRTLAGGAPRTLAHGYDVLGNRVETTLPDGRRLHWLFYGSGHLHQVNLEENGRHRIIADMERDALHREIARTQGALRSSFEYDPLGRLIRHRAGRVDALAGGESAGKGVLAIDREYRYDAAGNLVARLDARRGDQAYRYDPAGRIIAATGRQEEYFAFDPAGNLLEDRPGVPGKVSGNRLAVYQDLRYEYDVHGNVTTRRKGAHEQACYAWNADHQLQQATVTRHGVTQTTRYEYDALGRRTRKIDAFGTTEYLWDRHLMIESCRGNKASLFVFEPHGFIPVATLQDENLYWYQCDQIGTPQELTDAQGRIVWAADYQVWGEARIRNARQGEDNGGTIAEPLPEVAQPFRFQGQQFDDETGLHYNRFRYYDPKTGRFLSPDPIGLDGGFNLFSYAANPFSWIDPLGLSGVTPDSKGNLVPQNDYGVPDRAQFEPKKGISKYKRSSNCGPTTKQTASVQGQACVVCGTVDPKMVADHIDPLVVEHYRTGTNDVAHQTSLAAVQPHCPSCSRKQGGMASAFSKCMGGKI